MMYPLVRDLAADRIPVAVTCRVLGFSKQAFYAWRANPVSQRDWDDAHLINAAIDIHHDDPEFGYRFIADELAEHGIVASRNRVNRLCTPAAALVGARPQARPQPQARTAGPRRPGRAASSPPTGPNVLWLTDITEHPTGEGKLYLCAVKDACSNRIVGYSIDRPDDLRSWPSTRCATPSPCAGRVGTVVHSDRGSQFRSHAYVRALRERRPARVDGPGRGLRRQRRDGVLLQPAAEERPQPPTLADPRRAPPGDRHLDREDLPPPTPPRPPRPTHTHRIRDTPTGRSRGLNAPTQTSQPKSGQTHQLVSRDHVWLEERPGIHSRFSLDTSGNAKYRDDG